MKQVKDTEQELKDVLRKIVKNIIPIAIEHGLRKGLSEWKKENK